MALILEILKFLISSPDMWCKIKEIKDLQTVVWNLMLDREEIEDDIKVDQTILMHYDRQVEKIGEEIGIAT